MSMEQVAAKVKRQANILILDIERLPGMVPIFDQKTSGFVPVSRWTRLPSLLCFAAKWHGAKGYEFHAAWDDHEQMVKRAHELYDQADIVVTFNGKRFDNKHLRSDWLVAGLAPPSPWKDVDLYQVSAQHFGFESKSLNHLCHRLGLDTKDGHYDPVLAEKCMDGDSKAQRLMKRYNQGDVKITEQAYTRLLPWIHNHPTMVKSMDERPTCNKCPDGGELEQNGTYLANQIIYKQFQCKRCGGWVRGTKHARAAGTHGVK